MVRWFFFFLSVGNLLGFVPRCLENNPVSCNVKINSSSTLCLTAYSLTSNRMKLFWKNSNHNFLSFKSIWVERVAIAVNRLDFQGWFVIILIFTLQSISVSSTLYPFLWSTPQSIVLNVGLNVKDLHWWLCCSFQ